MAVTCKKQSTSVTSYYRMQILHWLIMQVILNYLYTPLTFPTGATAAGDLYLLQMRPIITST